MALMEKCDSNLKKDPSPATKSEKVEEDFKLPQLLQRLPQELFDRIYDFTFTARPGVRFIDHQKSVPADSAVRFVQGCNFLLVHPGRLRSGLDPFRYRSYTVERIPAQDRVAKPCNIHLLHVDRASRQRYADTFFGGADTFFVFVETDVLVEFMGSLQSSHKELVQARLSLERTELEEQATCLPVRQD
ncbi:hypothetical protein PRZ48_014195 [Zasmidium cellare]|uniref:Uncharacterized protein n=1 Tax=Zasmidium cellare TaxID=395010 RepID=A0ABR0E0B0_ZASCE|nr:hypothetical protein PRZ48_014195 [Zasmidium cellare]